MNTECIRVADQLRRAFDGDPWHGDPLSILLLDVTEEQAKARPLKNGHSIEEIVLHIDIYVRVGLDAIEGITIPKLYEGGLDWPAPSTDWESTKKAMLLGGEQLAQAIETFTDERLQTTALGRDYNFYYLFHGIVQHSLYHGGQIALLKKALSAS